ncbi:Uncharacterised protein [Amycolatopsis camponoti]|uniref:Rho termination factor N-terminal domain-containing protein n=1 Tax=Amycolatopsis camponoti TaxID=2606593 RepID=A0A6I8LEB2_9PSEU|nr:hypothetical protein [Amycolatopsis camponoti]VVJ15343.1 Uncharacterised protein [Amycolatopsis camponoti]
MSDLKSYVSLQARLFDFLAQQEESTLQAIADGTLRLTVTGADDVSRETPVDPLESPSSEPVQAARDLPKLDSRSDRRIYLNAAKPTVAELKATARNLGIKITSGVRLRDDLIEYLAVHAGDRDDVSRPEHEIRPRAPLAAVADKPDVSRRSPTPETLVPDDDRKPAVDVAAIASHLRELETESDGAAYLDAQRLDKAALLAVAAELQLTRVTRLSQRELKKRVLYQAIGARRKFAGLRKW